MKMPEKPLIGVLSGAFFFFSNPPFAPLCPLPSKVPEGHHPRPEGHEALRGNLPLRGLCGGRSEPEGSAGSLRGFCGGSAGVRGIFQGFAGAVRGQRILFGLFLPQKVIF